MAARVATLLEGDPATVVGHSMGGKVAMVLALTRPELVERLVVADMSPVDYGTSEQTAGGVLHYATDLLELDLGKVERREDADMLLAAAEPNDTIRAFLLQNLRRDTTGEGPDSWRWAANLELVVRDGAVLAGWPEDRLAGLAPYGGRVLWLAGERSAYIRPEYDEAMRRWFPHYRKVTIKGAGHWLHSERPDVFVEALRQFVGD
jgi:pimeloyl-ACP methyl ester carboxylesterase